MVANLFLLLAAGTLVAAGVYLLLDRAMTKMIMGLMMIGNGANLLLLISGGPAGAPPIVVIGTTRDPATPMKWSEALADQLESGVLIRRDGDGHTGYHVGNGCVDEAVEDYLIAGTVPTDGLSC